MSIKILGHKTLYRHDRFFSAFPSLVTLQSGKTALAFRRAGDHRWLLGDPVKEDFDSVDHLHFRSHIAFGFLGADLTFEAGPNMLPVHPEAVDQDANLFQSVTGRLFQYGFLWYPITAEVSQKLKEQGRHVRGNEHTGAGFLFWGGYTRFSDDEGKTWSEHHVLPVDEKHPSTRWPVLPGSPAIRGRMIQQADGSLLMAAYGWGLEGRAEEAVRLYRSSDDGESWTELESVLDMDGVHLVEPALAQWPSGQVTIFCRTGKNDDHLVTLSGDGCVFGAPASHQVKGHPYDPLLLPDGRLLLVYGYRHEPMGVRGRLVSPGQALSDAEEIIFRDDSLSRDTGYPSATVLPDGRILIAYYIADKRGIRGIEGTLLELT